MRFIAFLPLLLLFLGLLSPSPVEGKILARLSSRTFAGTDPAVPVAIESEEDLAALMLAKEKEELSRAVDAFSSQLTQWLPSDTQGRDAIVLYVTGDEAWCRLLMINILALTEAIETATRQKDEASSFGAYERGRVDIIALHTLPAKQMSQGCRRALRSLGLILIEMPPSMLAVGSQALDTPNRCGDIRHCWIKFLAWSFTQYSTVMFLDADILALKDPRPAFTLFRAHHHGRSNNSSLARYDIGASPDLIYAHLHVDTAISDIFNSGVFVIEPSTAVSKELFHYGLDESHWHGNGDNTLMADFFLYDRPFASPESRTLRSLGATNWIRLPAAFNVNPHLWHVASMGHQNKDGGFIAQDLRNVIMLHFVWPSKRLWSISPCYREPEEQLERQAFTYAFEVCTTFHSRRLQGDRLIADHGGLQNPLLVEEVKKNAP